MYFETKKFNFKTNKELDDKLTSLFHRGWEPIFYKEKWFGSEVGGKAIIKFKVQDV